MKDICEGIKDILYSVGSVGGVGDEIEIEELVLLAARLIPNLTIPTEEISGVACALVTAYQIHPEVKGLDVVVVKAIDSMDALSCILDQYTRGLHNNDDNDKRLFERLVSLIHK